MSNHDSNKNRTTTVTSQPSLILGDLGEHDVLLGRGAGPNMNQGNKHFRDLLGKHKKVYSESSKMVRGDIVLNTILEVKMKHGRFVETATGKNPRDGGSAVYKEVEDSVALIKTRQAFRCAIRNLNDNNGAQVPTFFPKKQVFSEDPTQKNNTMMRADHVSSLKLSPLSSIMERKTLPHDPRLELLNTMIRLKARDTALARRHATTLATMPSNFLNMSAFRNQGLELGPLFAPLPRGYPNTALRFLAEESLAASQSQLLLGPYAASLPSSPRLPPKQQLTAALPLEDLVMKSMTTRMALRGLSHST
jgi:hypothetical protein